MAKLTDKQKKKIVADYVETNNYSETARINKVNEKTVRRIVKADTEILEKAEQKKKENTETTLQYMQKQHETKKRILDKLLNAIEEKSENIDMFTNIKDLATAYGILLDKELKVAEINLKRNTGNNEEINKGLQNIADLINNPKKVRTEEDLKE
jgi:hypothetical protein